MMVRHRLAAALVTATVGLVDFGVAPVYGMLPSFFAALGCSIATAILVPLERPYSDGCPRPGSRGVFHAALGGALWALAARECYAPRATWQQGFLLVMNAACLTASAYFHDAAQSRRAHDRRLFVDVVFAGLPMIAMLAVFRWTAFERVASAAFMLCLAAASYAEILLRRTGHLEALRSLCIVVYFSMVEYRAFAGSPVSWATFQAVAFACCFSLLLFVDGCRKGGRPPTLRLAPHHSGAWTAHEDAHVFLGIAQALVYHRSISLHSLVPPF